MSPGPLSGLLGAGWWRWHRKAITSGLCCISERICWLIIQGAGIPPDVGAKDVIIQI